MTYADLPGYRRRILIEPGEGVITTELEDDYHRMVVTLGHADGVITSVESAMKRSPWTTCPGAMAQLRATFLGKALDAASVRDEKTLNCTHLFDLATFAAAHARETAPVSYEIAVSDPVDGAVKARLWRDGGLLFDWRYTDSGMFTAPADMAGMPMTEIGRWIAAQPRDLQEPVRILRWATMIAHGRRIEMPAGISATRFATGACFTFQPEMAKVGTRRPGADVDFTALGEPPMADREDMFVREKG